MNVESDKMYLRAMWTWFTLTCVHCARIAWYLGIVLFVAATVALTVFRYWLPALSERKVEIETFVSQQIGHKVTIGEMSADWRGLYPSLHIKDLLLHGEDGREEKLSLEELSLTLDLVPLLQGRFVFRQVTLLKPRIEVTRTREGNIRIGRLPALKKQPQGSTRDLSHSLFRQEYVVVEDGAIEWRDELLGEKPFHLTDININLENSKRNHAFSAELTLPGDRPRIIMVNAELRGNPLHDRRWSGQANTRVSDLDIRALPGIVLEALGTSGLEGRLSLDLDTSWRDGIIDSARGKVETEQVAISLGRFGKTVSLSSFRAGLDLTHEDGHWRMRLGDVWIALDGKPWRMGNARLDYRRDETSLLLEQVRLERLRPVLDALTSDNRIIRLVKDLYPAGMARNTRFSLYGPLKKPRDFLFEMYVDNASINAYKIYPAATGLTGLIRVTRTGGMVDATVHHSTLVLEKVYDHPLQVDEGKARVTWERGEQNWHVRNSDMWLRNADAEVAAQFHVLVPLDKTVAPTMELSVDLRNGNLVRADHYYPVRLLDRSMNDWLSRLKLRGRATRVKLNYQGAVRGFPVRGAERFDVIASLESTSMNFLRGWPRVSGFDGDLVIDRSDLWLTGAAADLVGQRVDDATVHLSGLDKAGQKDLAVAATLSGETSRLVDFLLTGPLFGDQDLRDLNMAAAGRGVLSLKLSLPLAQPEKNTVEGHYRFTKADLMLPDESWLTGLTGRLDFTDRSVTAKGIHGQYLGGDIAIDIATTRAGRPPVTRITATGEALMKELAPLLGDWIVAGLDGAAAWQGDMTLGDGAPRLHVGSDMAGVVSRFPLPLAKSVDSKWPLALDAVFPDASGPRVDFSLADRIQGRLYVPENAKGPELDGCIGIGAGRVECPPGNGLKLALRLVQVETTPWLDYLAASDEGDGEWPGFIVGVDAVIGRLNAAGVDMGRLNIDLERKEDGYMRGRVNGDKVAGEVGILWTRNRQHIETNLDRLIWNEGEPDYPDTASRPDPGDFPALDVEIADMQFRGMQLGRMTLNGAPTSMGWQLDSLRLQRPDMKVSVTGRWRGSLLNHVSSFDVDFTSTDMLATLQALDVNTEMETDDFHAFGYLSWDDTPFDFDFSILNGALDIRAGRGRLSSVEVGAGRLLGALNVDTLRRRLLLDFSDLFEEGFAFDEIDSRMTIKLGQAHVTRFIMPGPAATIRMEGRLGLADEDIDMKMAISPAVGGNLAVAGFALGGPVAGVATYLAQKAIQKQMNKSANYKYHVVGSWDDPVVEKLASPEPEQQRLTGGTLESNE